MLCATGQFPNCYYQIPYTKQFKEEGGLLQLLGSQQGRQVAGAPTEPGTVNSYSHGEAETYG